MKSTVISSSRMPALAVARPQACSHVDVGKSPAALVGPSVASAIPSLKRVAQALGSLALSATLCLSSGELTVLRLETIRFSFCSPRAMVILKNCNAHGCPVCNQHAFMNKNEQTTSKPQAFSIHAQVLHRLALKASTARNCSPPVLWFPSLMSLGSCPKEKRRA
jgi:hypothetical protein